MRSVLQMLELEGPDAETTRRLLAPLQRETAKAERRRSNGKETDAEGGAPPGTDGTGEPAIDEDALGAGVD
ncbi:hypothetical protein [Sorangium sp. So ce341]|uniref:hypothetical protein n=1 Tax=Sorangium sp. So ce341 TaxID=3133302 RepID=UPI003F61310F